MNTNYLNKITRKVAVIASIVGVSALVGTPVIAQSNQTPGSTTESPTEPATTPATTPTPEATPTPGAATTGNLVEVAQASGSFSTLTQAVQEAGLAEKLSSGEYTLFAPTDQAFSASLPTGAVEFLLQPENKDLLRQVLTYHVVPREVTSNQLKTGTVKTLGGGLAVRVTPQRVIINDASVVEPNIEASNGVIHAVNRVLLPPQLRQTIASRLEQQPTQTVPGQTTPDTQTTPAVPGQTTPDTQTTPAAPGQTTPDTQTTPAVPGQTTPDTQTTPEAPQNQAP
ncbi:fasciclin domain-containing protein [Chlorogloeopsis fritschii]|uniref:fasciclin domain-containing protein n=1 Tax=Chlorogloeopsis fritschii TaxID=1124 RepID=UPI0023F03787|nr:fasciclin domain-containing protein [Chlorogloeopsis fritschii]